MKLRLAAIDIGSNAARLLISDVTDNFGKPEFNKINLVRVPLRLGFDVFEKKEISAEKVDMLLHTLKAYKHLLEAYEVDYIKAAGTSAMRDAANAPEIIRRVKRLSGDRQAQKKSRYDAAFRPTARHDSAGNKNRTESPPTPSECPPARRPDLDALRSSPSKARKR